MKTFKVGFREGCVFDRGRRNWSNDGPRPIQWSAWYPTVSEAVEQTISVPKTSPFFIMGSVALDAELYSLGRRLPVVLLSHGTGGTASSLGWMAEALARIGHVVIGVNHHGNTASEPYRAEGFLCWWERPRDLSVALDLLATDGVFADRLDTDRVTCVGFSLGGYTALSILGAITEMHRFGEWAAKSRFEGGPREFPDLADRIAPLLRNSAVFASSWELQSESYLDRRVAAAVALAPAPTVRAFAPNSLVGISVPVTLMAGEADLEAPMDACARWLHERLPNSQLHSLGRDVGHYTLLSIGTENGRDLEPDICIDAPGIDRQEVHRQAIEIALKAVRSDSPPNLNVRS
ncbi:hypothetical protein NS365_18350 [Aureimonas ureilytica]|uniref:AB hydrolase-1 domain-containing protein n=2 Tax=Aureimonas ureilytica TaxID=401562 RepID=A0A175RIG5_9HYPH|nr:alpha/beta fold hydrolase [Aureimonas ureilytica]KTQ97527.1 hypothetical protein NS226_04445 [Aureimonas ureilytica]KTR03560.1 hypothetical protein NS365_18350 [Aureimonas ureilytica]